MSVVLITLDHMAAHQIGAYGQIEGRTPSLDQLATRSAVFHNAYAHAIVAPGQSPSDDWISRGESVQHISIPSDASVRFGNSQTESDRNRVLKGALGNHSIRLSRSSGESNRDWVLRAAEAIRGNLESPTDAVLWIQSAGIADPWIPTHPGWEDAVARHLRTTWNELLADESPDMTPDQAVRELAAEGHFSRSKTPTLSDIDVNRLSVALYQTCVERLDEHLGRLIREYQRHAKPDSLLIVAGLQGDELPYAWPADRPMTLNTQRVQTPLFIQPGQGLGSTSDRDTEGASVQELVQTIDIIPTIDDWFHHRNELATARNLLAIAGHQQSARECVIVRDSTGETLVRTANAQYVVRASGHDMESQEWLTLKPHDAWDLLDVASQNPELVDQLQELSKRV